MSEEQKFASVSHLTNRELVVLLNDLIDSEFESDIEFCKYIRDEISRRKTNESQEKENSMSETLKEAEDRLRKYKAWSNSEKGASNPYMQEDWNGNMKFHETLHSRDMHNIIDAYLALATRDERDEREIEVPECVKEMKAKQCVFRHDMNFVLVDIPHEGQMYQSTSFMIDVNTQLYRVKADTELAKYIAALLNK